jgi:hypothetical protein
MRERSASTTMASSLSGYVVVPRCPMIFDGTNHADFATHIRVHMCGIRLWGILCGKVSCPTCPIALVAPVPPTPTIIAVDASEANRGPRLLLMQRSMLMISR